MLYSQAALNQFVFPSIFQRILCSHMFSMKLLQINSSSSILSGNHCLVLFLHEPWYSLWQFKFSFGAFEQDHDYSKWKFLIFSYNEHYRTHNILFRVFVNTRREVEHYLLVHKEPTHPRKKRLEKESRFTTLVPRALLYQVTMHR